MHYMTVRHHHAAGATLRTGSNSVGWAENVWCLFGCSRVGAAIQHYRNGVALDTDISVGGLIDPESNAARDLVIGTRFTKNQNWFNGRVHRPRVWARALAASEHACIFEKERGWFGL